ncbi:MAG: FAD-binding oxidoreductase [Pseudomonadota bacterium]
MTLFSDDYKLTPFWWDRTPRPSLEPKTLPKAVDVVVIGAGYTGLCAALQTARAGRSTLVLDAEDVGWGCSSRNGGQISTSLKPELSGLGAKYGERRALEILQEGPRSLQWVQDFIRTENIDCDLEVKGKFLGAHNAAQFKLLTERVENPVRGLETDAYIVSRSEQQSEIGSDFYHGGAVYPRIAAVDPGRYHQGILERVLQAQATVMSHCPVLDLREAGSGFRVNTASGAVQASQVIVATNGYTSPLTPWLRRRIIPIGSYIIATDVLSDDLMDQLIPQGRVLGDTRKMVFYYRACPERKRVLFGGRVSLFETDAKLTGPRLHQHMTRIFPQLEATRISHSWAGFVGYTFDSLPHLGNLKGLFYSMGYCGSGVGMASYLGMRIGQKLLDTDEGKTAFDDLKFETRPLYTGHPWFLAASLIYYQWRDSLAR